MLGEAEQCLGAELDRRARLRGIIDRVSRAGGRFEAGRGDPVERLLAGSTAADRLGDTSPAALLPLRVPSMLIHGGLDDTSPPAQCKAYVVKARAAGDILAWSYAIPGEGHVEEIAPGSGTWSAVAASIESVFASRDGSWTLYLPAAAP